MTGGPGPLLVVKYGGSSLASGERMGQAARAIREHPAGRKLVVVSAPGDFTDRLLALARGTGNVLGSSDVAHLLSLGERVSARLLTSVLNAQGSRAICLEPEDPRWPVYTRGDYLGAELDFETTASLAGRHLVPLLEECIVVVCGFLGRQGTQVSTLARGGSDTTALALGNALSADEVLLVKDVSGILDADPRVVPGATRLEEITAEELLRLSQGGARVVSPESLAYLRPGSQVRVVPFGPSLSSGQGTRLSLPPPPARVEGEGDADPAPPHPLRGTVGALTLVPHSVPEALRALQGCLSPDRWLGLSITPEALVLFLQESETGEAARELHSTGAFRAVAIRNGVRDIPWGMPGTAPLGSGLEGGQLLGVLPAADGLRLLLSDGRRDFWGERDPGASP